MNTLKLTDLELSAIAIGLKLLRQAVDVVLDTGDNTNVINAITSVSAKVEKNYD